MPLKEMIHEHLKTTSPTEEELGECLTMLIQELYYAQSDRTCGPNTPIIDGEDFRLPLFRNDDLVCSCDVLIRVVNTLADDEVNKTL